MGLSTTTTPEIVAADADVDSPALDEATAAKRDALLETLRGYGRVAVAYSGGVDSAVVAIGAVLSSPVRYSNPNLRRFHSPPAGRAIRRRGRTTAGAA